MCPVGAWDVVACARDDGAVKGDAVGLVGRGSVEGVLEQVLESGVGVEVAFCYSRGWSVGMLKMADFRVPPASRGNLKEQGY